MIVAPTRRWIIGLTLLVPVLSMGSAGIRASENIAVAQDAVWQFTAERPTGALPRADLIGAPAHARFSKAAFDVMTAFAPRNDQGMFVTTLPMPDGTFARFQAVESPMLVPALAAAAPDIVTFRGQGIDDPTATTRFGWTLNGFHAIVLSATGTSYIDPYERGNTADHVVFRKADHDHQGDAVRCLVGMGMDSAAGPMPMRSENQFPFSHGTALRTFRLALAATGEYTSAAGGTRPLALARMVETINRVNSVYERDLSVRLQLVTGSLGDSMALIFTNGATDPYNNFDGFAMLAQNQTTIDTVVGTGGYDVGHVFSTGGGGVATLRSVCVSSSKARGVTGSSNPTGDAFDIDYVAHELGHQFGGNHTFNGLSSSCGANRSVAHAYEVGSGSTIQGYAGICGAENLQRHSDDYFHVESLDEMTAFLTSGNGATCGTITGAINTPPSVSTPSAFTIPRQTPFVLSASGSDANGDVLSYSWEHFNLGGATSSALSAGSDLGGGPLFRSYAPTSSPLRTFPSMVYVLHHGNTPPLTYACGNFTCLTGEALPDTNRTMRFMLTARDNRASGGAISTAMVDVTVTTQAGPFVVTSPNAPLTVTGGAPLTVTWNPNQTQAAPVNASQVEISLSTDGGTTFSSVLASSAPNTGSATVTMPNTPTSTARVRIGAVGNVFFDVSDANFTIVAGASPTPSACPGAAPVAGWVCVNGGWVPADHPSAGGASTPTPPQTPTPTPPPTPTPSSCAGNSPVSGWVCVNGGWVPPNHPLAIGAPTPTPTPTPSPTPTPGACVGNPPVAGWVCTASGGWVPPNHPLAGGGRPD